MLLRADFTHNLRVRKQAQSLAAAGWDVTVIALALGGQQAGPEIDPDGFTLWRVQDSLFASGRSRAATAAGGPASRNAPGKRRNGAVNLARLVLNRLVVMLRMVRVVRRVRPDVVESHNVNTLPAGYVGARVTGAALAYDAHEINIEREGYYAKIRPLIYRVEKFAVPRAALVMSTTDLRSEHYQRTYRLRSKPLVIQNKPRYSAEERNDYLHEACNIPADQRVVLYQGGLQEGRGLHNLVRVAAKVRGATFVFLGNGAQESSLRELARSLRVENVCFHAAVPLESLPSVTASADIGVQVLRNTCLNHYTTDSNKIFEYAMGGLAVVASDFPEIRRIIEAHDYGLLVDPDSVEDIAAAVQRLVDDDALRGRLQANARNSRRALSWESQEEAYLSAMTRTLEGA
ncbi:MAG TPA: glycosyltransferase [Gammaproteobacteria bacterium]